jgi:hypothetical protein
MFPGQVFGLCRLNPTNRTSQIFDPVSSSAFVPAYRCGAVPDSHRIPFCTLSAWPRDRGIDSLYMGLRERHTRYCGYPVKLVAD